MTAASLEDLLRGSKSVTALLYNQQTGPNVYPGVPAEYTNWRDEQEAWQKTCVLFNQSYHMADLIVEGPDALKLLSYLAYNSFKGFESARPSSSRRAAPTATSSATSSCSTWPRTPTSWSAARRCSTGSGFTPKPAITTSGSSSTSAR